MEIGVIGAVMCGGIILVTLCHGALIPAAMAVVGLWVFLKIAKAGHG